MGSSSSVTKKEDKTQTTPDKNNKIQKQEQNQNSIIVNQRQNRKLSVRAGQQKKSINISYKDGESQDNNDDRDSFKQQDQNNNNNNKDSSSDLDEGQNVNSKQDLNSRAESRAQNINNSNGKRNTQKQNSYRSPSYVQFQKEHFHNHKIYQQNQTDKRLFGDFYTGNVQATTDKNTPTYLVNSIHEDTTTILNKEDLLKKKDLLQSQSKEKKSPSVEVESKNIVEIKERNQNFFAKGNVVLSVNQFNSYKNEKIQNQEELQSQLLKQIIELGIKPTEYILNNSIKQEYEEKKNQISNYEEYGAKNQRNKNNQKVQIITYPGFQEMFQNKNNQQQHHQKFISS